MRCGRDVHGRAVRRGGWAYRVFGRGPARGPRRQECGAHAPSDTGALTIKGPAEPGRLLMADAQDLTENT